MVQGSTNFESHFNVSLKLACSKSTWNMEKWFYLRQLIFETVSSLVFCHKNQNIQHTTLFNNTLTPSALHVFELDAKPQSLYSMLRAEPLGIKHYEAIVTFALSSTRTPASKSH